ncbi:MAG: DUF3320 domain-containing protein [Verrucomicrobia bacterium]|nr:DUF3320 domain-containing protein [Verrucomicrobiota bacterium]MCH8511550.1 DUF3320 domain-containing protein [Kiritimatiellia bacterium]
MNTMDNEKSGLRAELDFSPRLHFAWQQNAVPVLRRLELRNESETHWTSLRVEIRISPEVSKPLILEIDDLKPRTDHILMDLPIHLDFQALSAWTERVRGSLSLSVFGAVFGMEPGEEAERTLLQESQDLEIFAWDEWTGLTGLPEILAAFVTPNIPMVETLLVEASDLLSQRTGRAALDGYQSRSRKRVYEIAAAIFDAVRAHNLRYSHPPASFERSGQRVRFAEQIFESGLATCLDLALLFAALLEQAGLRPLILLHEGHAYTGCWLEEDGFAEAAIDDLQSIRKRVELESLFVFETTLCTRDHQVPMEAAEKAAAAHLRLDAEFHFALDVRQARKSGIRPLPLRRDAKSVIPAGSAPEMMPVSGTREFQDEAPDDVPEAGGGPQTRLDRWKLQLLDLTLRNRLLNFRETKQTVPLLCPDIAALEDALATNAHFKIKEQSKLMSGADPRDLQGLNAEAGGDALRLHLQEETAAGRLRAPLTETELSRRLLDIFRKTRLEVEESGTNTLFLALGFLEWRDSPDVESPCLAPILLIPVMLKRHSVVEGFSLVREDADALVNVTLLEMLKRDFGKEIPGVDPPPEGEFGVDVPLVMRRFASAIREMKGWEVKPDVWLGRFSFNKFLLWKDLQDRMDDLTRNPVVDHLVNRPGEPFVDDIPDLAPEDMDARVDLAELYCPLSADSSQLAAVEASALGKNFVLHGPPGTGKSQTIANLITHNLAKGRRVLFVAEKRAALEVVHRRLCQLGMGPFCLELHSNKAGKADVLRQFGEALDLAESHEPAAWASNASQMTAVRDRINAYVHDLHRPGLGGFSAQRNYAKLIETKGRDPAFRLKFSEPDAHDPARYEHLLTLVRQLTIRWYQVNEEVRTAFRPFAATSWTPDWEDRAVAAAESLREATKKLQVDVEAASRALGVEFQATDIDVLYHFVQLSAYLLKGYTLPSAFLTAPGWKDFQDAATSQWIPAGERHRSASRTLSGFNLEALHALNLPALEAKVNALKAKGGFLSRIRVKLTLRVLGKARQPEAGKWKGDDVDGLFSAYHKLIESERLLNGAGEQIRARLGTHWKGTQTDWEYFTELLAFGEQLQTQLTALANGDPRRLIEHRAALGPLLAQGGDCFGEGGLLAKPIRNLIATWDDFMERRDTFVATLQLEKDHVAEAEDIFAVHMRITKAVINQRRHLHAWCAWREVRAEARTLELGPVIDSLEDTDMTADALCHAFEQAYHVAGLRHRLNHSPALRDFWCGEHEQLIHQFRELDDRHMRLSVEMARARCAARMPGARNRDAVPNSELGILQRERAKKARHKPVRRLLSEIPAILPRLKPCLLMSPLSVAQYLDASCAPFDLVVFDEASQIAVWDAVGAIARARQVVVVGDPKQLPPTNFFQRTETDEFALDDGLFEDLESILDECLGSGLPAYHLNWHYRSRNEKLIAFSNHYYYENRLFTFPNPESDAPGVHWRHVPEGCYDKGGTRSNRGEADAVVLEILERLRDPRRQNQSLGVVTFSQAQQDLVENLLETARRKHPEIEPWFDENREEPVFVKNLENVQGDERDVILFTVGYGPDAHGKVSMNFGPLNREGGERRLNVAVTRAKMEVLIFSTLRAEQIDLSRTKAPGVAHLKAYLEYARRGPRVLGEAQHRDVQDSDAPFEMEVARFLETHGYEVHARVGCSGYRIDLAVVDPGDADGYLAGIECDGRSYRQAATARDRDRLRQMVLESLGWKMLRVWIPEWHRDRVQAERHLLEALSALKDGEGLAKPSPDIAETSVKFEAQSEAPPPSTSAEKQVKIIHPGVKVVPMGDSEGFYQPRAEKRIAKQIQRILEAEGPILERELHGRILEEWGFKRTGDRIRQILDPLMPAEPVTQTAEGETVYWPQNIDPNAYRAFRVPDPRKPETRRSPENIPPIELANAMRWLLEDYASLPMDDLFRECLKLFGGKQLTEKQRPALVHALELLADETMIQDDVVTFGV